MAERPEYKQRGSPDESAATPPSASNTTPPQNPEHMLCSELVDVIWKDPPGPERCHTANLEEVWRNGAILEMEEVLPVGVTVFLRRASELDRETAAEATPFPASFEFEASVGFCRQSDIGYTVGINFVEGSEWDPTVLLPSHAVNPVELKERAEADLESAGADQEAQPDDRSSDPSQRASTHPSLETLARRRAVDNIVEQGSLFQLATRIAGL